MSFGQCCGPLLRGEQTAADAQALMRSRYSAYVLGDVAYLRRSWHPSTCPPGLSLDDNVQWLGLKIERYLPISDSQAEVVFVARYRNQGHALRLHEHSRFVREQGRWLYLDAK
ncbi:MAG: YchJ family metal-binding protein [Brachymonas sp.]|nr:YchJ family metal-binding protein [Brachymonas sp.]